MSVTAFKDGKTWPLTQQQNVISNTTDTALTANSIVIVPANYSRKYLQITNTDAANYVYLAFGVDAVIHEGIRLGPAGSAYFTYVMDRESIYTGAIHAIALGGNCIVTIAQGSG